MNRRVVVTGAGVIAPRATGTEEFWNLITSGRTASRTISTFDPRPFRSQVAAECDFVPHRHGLTAERAEELDRATQFALAAASQAIADSGLTDRVRRPDRTGVSIGNAVGCTQQMERQYLEVSDGGRRWRVDADRASEHFYDYFVPSSIAAELAWNAGAEGPAAVISAGCTSGIDAVGHAFELVREGSADTVITGGTEAPIAPITVACFDAIRATSPSNDDPAGACKPFDSRRNGFVLGEGAAVLVLEERQKALARGARILGEITGYASRGNAHHMTGLRPDGRELAAAVTAALAQGRTLPEEVDYVNAHGTATRQNDRHETAALKRALADRARSVPVSSIKPVVGHSLGAIGAIEIVACLLAIRHGVVPPTANLHESDAELDLDYVPLTAREHRVRTALTVGSGFGGFQSAMVLTDGKG
ncbi:beta-ketoacyl-[acyl-carrier-protein] synthase family protein [Thermobifida alba]|uniref:Beta-ketoacyl-[acyl-carrier-protein] synthase family protein n=1 Tax=Thermobifida alba TaxID=53522 RepID=A0ABY4KZG9_THEAE|nr:beta-ketoacyl-[acyl-carrier-protein] synthase family protein [Thermobifida alba]UPT20831.1 beta-ketoacyl-[acyl-carrier-protein] synthase family protein [Thermobifida alba]